MVIAAILFSTLTTFLLVVFVDEKEYHKEQDTKNIQEELVDEIRQRIAERNKDLR